MIFVGKLVETSRTKAGTLYTFDLVMAYKGKPGERITVASGRSNCAMKRLRKSRTGEYLVYVGRSSVHAIHLCGRTAPTDWKQARGDIKRLKAG